MIEKVKEKKYVRIKENFRIYDDFIESREYDLLIEWKKPLMGTQFSLTISD